MVIGVSAAINFGILRGKYEKALEEIDLAIARFDGECTKPLLYDLSGIDLVDSTIVLLDATLNYRLQEAQGIARLPVIRLYLEKLKEVYFVNKDKLDDIPATRKEMLALGLAVRHIAVGIDYEFESLRALRRQVDH